MQDRLKRAVAGGVDAVLRRQGYEGLDFSLARRDTIAWLNARRAWVVRRQRPVSGLAVVIATPSRAALRPIELPMAGPGQVTVETLTTAVSPGTERAEWLRRPNLQPPFPYTPGYSGAGVVLASGPGEHTLSPGVRVAVWQLRHASVATMPAAYAHAIPDGVTTEAAALVYLAIISGYGVQRAGAIGDRDVCIVGAGTIGALAHRLAMLQRPASVTVVASSRRREEAARRAGADRFMTVDDDLASIGAPVVIEASGDPEAINVAVAAAAPGATVVLLGSPWRVTRDVPVETIQRKRLRVVGAHISALATEAKLLDDNPFRRIADRFLLALGNRELDVDDLIGESVDPREIQRFYRRLGAGEVTAAHLDWTRIPRAERVQQPGVFGLPTLPPKRQAVAAPHPVVVRSGSLRFAAIGCGDIGYKNARALAEAANAELVYAHDPVERLAEVTVEQFGGEVARSVEDALDPRRVDAVVLSVPHDLHAPLIERAAAAGIHVVVEKPLAQDLPTARRAAEVAERAGVALALLMPYRFSTDLRRARELVQAGALGDPLGAAIVFHDDQPDAYWGGGFSGRAASSWRLERARSGGGVLIMSLIHYLDFVRHVLGLDVTSVAATGLIRPGFEVEDAVAMTARFENGAVATILGSTSTRGRPPVNVEMWGEAGTILLQPHARIFTERAVDGVVANRWCELPPDDPRDIRARYIEAFVSAVLDGRAPEVSVADALALQAIIEAGYRSMDLGHPVELHDVVGERA